MTRLRAVCVAALATLMLGCPGGNGSEPAALADLPRGRVTIQGQPVDVEIARTAEARSQGLSGRASLAPGTGVLFLHGETARHAYWMKDMRFAIDILWLRAGRVVDIAHRVPPAPPGTADADLPTYTPSTEADAILELPAGYARTHGFDLGQRVSIEELD